MDAHLGAILHNHTILVISPLCNLITDQFNQINANVLKKKIAYNLSSSKSIDEENIDEKEVFDTNGSEDGAPRILFCTPEKLGTEIFRAKLMKKHKQTPFAYFVLDECHLIVESGNCFRADYMKVDWLRNELKDVPILCYSATCNHFVTDQIKSLLHMTNPTVFQNDNSKKNLFLSIHSVSKHNQTCKCGSKNCSWHSKSDITSDSIIKAVDYYQAGEVLVLCNSRSDVEKLNQHLQKILPSKIVEFYHAGLSDFGSRVVAFHIIHEARYDLIKRQFTITSAEVILSEYVTKDVSNPLHTIKFIPEIDMLFLC